MKVPVFLSGFLLIAAVTNAEAACSLLPSEDSMRDCPILFDPVPLAGQDVTFHFQAMRPDLVPPHKVEVQYFILEEPVVADATTDEDMRQK